MRTHLVGVIQLRWLCASIIMVYRGAVKQAKIFPIECLQPRQAKAWAAMSIVQEG